MFNRFKPFICGTAALLGAITLAQAQIGSPTPAPKSLPTAPAPDSQAKSPNAPAPPAASSIKASDNSQLTLVQASTTNPATSPATTTKTTAPATTTDPGEADSATDNGGVGVREFQGDDVGQVLRLLARQAKINMVVSETVIGTVTMRLEDVTA